MNENLYIAHKKTSTQNLACSQRQIHTVHTCKLSQAKTTKGHALIPTHPFPKVELCITVKCKNIYRVTNNEMCFQRRSERLNGVLLLDALGEDIPEGGSDISEGSLAVPLCLGIPGPGNIKERSRC